MLLYIQCPLYIVHRVSYGGRITVQNTDYNNYYYLLYN